MPACSSRQRRRLEPESPSRMTDLLHAVTNDDKTKRLPAIVREGLVGFCHAMRLFALLGGTAAAMLFSAFSTRATGSAFFSPICCNAPYTMLSATDFLPLFITMLMNRAIS